MKLVFSPCRNSQSFALFCLVFALAATPAFAETHPAAKGIVFASYNVENFLGPAKGEEGTHRKAKEKSEQAAAAVVRVIKDMDPDILGVCEMGDVEAFAHFRERLEASGLHYVDAEFVAGPDPDRHLALLSRFPIVSRQSQSDVEYQLDGRMEKVKRGFLDVTVRIADGTDLRLVGVHLKSKLSGDPLEALMRRNEANILRRLLDSILTADPSSRLLAYGDCNDTREQPAIQEIAGVRGTPGYMSELPAHDGLGDRWTHYWRLADSYTRIDYLFASRSLLAEIAPSASAVYRSDYWNEASDHRPVFTVITPGVKKRKLGSAVK